MGRFLPVVFFVVAVLYPGVLLAVDRQSVATVVKVIDGDSLVVKQDGKWLTIRLYGIDAPEYSQPYGRQSRQYLRQRVLGKQVSLTSYYRDSYGRTVALVEDASGTINESQVAEGLAWVYPRYCRKTYCATWQELQDGAKHRKMGLWRESGPSPPWQWKRKQRVN